MKKIKHLVIFLLMILLSLSLYACSGEVAEREYESVSSEQTLTDNTSGSDSVSGQNVSSNSVDSDSSSEQSQSIDSSKDSDSSQSQSQQSQSDQSSQSDSSETITYYNIFCYPSSNGSIVSSVNKAVSGTTVTITVTPYDNYVLSSVSISYGSTERQLTLNGNKASFVMPEKDVAVYANFNVRTYSIMCMANANGSLRTDPDNVAVEGANVTVTGTSSTEYILEEVTLTYGTTSYNLILSNSTATFTMPAANVTLSAKFAKLDNRQYISHMVLGDSYTDLYFWGDFYSDMSILPVAKTVGIGATQTTLWMEGLTKDVNFWGERQLSLTTRYNISNFIFHIGINDISIGEVSAEETISRLKTLFSMYHEAYPNAQIYWVTISYISSHSESQVNSCKTINAAIKSYSNSYSYLTVIDTTSVMFPSGVTNPDWFADGVHFNPDGYATWSTLILDALGYKRDKLYSFGSAGLYNSGSTFFDSGDGTVSNFGEVFYEQSIWFDGVYSQNAYAEMKVTVNSVTNNNEVEPKFGPALKVDGNHLVFYIYNKDDKICTNVGSKYPTPIEDSGVLTSGTWYFDLPYSVENVNASYTNGNYVKLGLLKSSSDLYFFVNDVLVNSVTGLYNIDLQSAIGLTVFNCNVTIKDYSVTTDILSVINRFNVNRGATHSYDDATATTAFFFNINTAPCNFEFGEEISAWTTESYSRFYYQFDIHLDSVLNNDQYPKAGIAINVANVGTLLFYIDSVNVGNFGANQYVGCVFRPNGGTWDWNNSQTVLVPDLKYTTQNGTEYYATLGVYKNGGRYVMTVNGNVVLEINRADMSGSAKAGIMVFNLAFLCFSSELATSDAIINKIVSDKSI